MLQDQLSDQVGWSRGLPDDQNAGEPMDNGLAYGQRGQGLPCILGIGEAVLAADLIMRLISKRIKHLKPNYQS